jgi:hypothetical protein
VSGGTLLKIAAVAACLVAAAPSAQAGVYGPAGPARALANPTTGMPVAQGSVRSASDLRALARNPRSAGKTFLVHAGDYGDVDLRGVRHKRAVTFRAAPGARPVFDYTTMGDTRGLRLRGLRIVGGIDIQPGDNRRIQIVHNDIGGYAGVGVNVRERSRDILIKGNRFHDLRFSAQNDIAGYGVRVSSPRVEIRRVRIVGNTFERLGNDAMEIGGVEGVLVARNVVRGVDIEPGSGAHADPFFLWAGTRRATIRGNRFIGNNQPVYLRGGTAHVVFENNVVAKSDNWCMQVGGKGLPGDGIAGLVMRNNTVWGCHFGGVVFGGAGGGWRIQNNILQTLSGAHPTGHIDVQGYNLIRSGWRTRADRRGRPRFVDAAHGDFRLARGSAAVDAGTSAGAPRHDLLGHRRRDDPSARNRGGGRVRYYDIGAYERVAAARR